VGHGASAGIPDDVAELIAVDMGALGEGLQGNEHAVSICAKDSGGPYDLGIRRRLVALAHGIPYKLDIYPFYGSDAEAALRVGGPATWRAGDTDHAARLGSEADRHLQHRATDSPISAGLFSLFAAHGIMV
jgi:hypothetical protein